MGYGKERAKQIEDILLKLDRQGKEQKNEAISFRSKKEIEKLNTLLLLPWTYHIKLKISKNFFYLLKHNC